MMFKELLNPNYGWVDYYMGVVGLPAHVEWLSNSDTAWIAIIALDVWQWTPFVTLILIAGLQSLPHEPREAAAIDGANAWQTFRHVILAPARRRSSRSPSCCAPSRRSRRFDAFRS